MDNRPQILITGWMPKEGRDILEKYCDLDFCNSENPLSKTELIQRAKNKDGVVIFMTDTIDKEVIQACNNLKVISSFGKGFDNIDVEECAKRGIAVTINKNSLTEDTADMAMGLALANARNILIGDSEVRKGTTRGWQPKKNLGRSFNHSNLGIIGYGEIGKAIAKRAKGFSMTTYYYDPTVESVSWGAHKCEKLEEMFSKCDFIMITANLNKNSYHLVNRDNISYMKQGAFVVNVARGSIVDEKAIEEALDANKISGYASDVFAFEDKLAKECPQYISSGLLEKTEKTVFTPHLGTGTVETRKELSISTAKGMLSVLKGEETEQLITSGEANMN